MHDIGNRMGFKVNQIGPVHPTVEGGYQAALALEGGGTTAIIIYNDLDRGGHRAAVHRRRRERAR